jgi:hypothetical protein
MHAEYKQVTVLFADVVHSMSIAAAVGAERLREIMAELADRCAAVVKRFGGTVDKFTGDGIMAIFGAPVALEDHAIRACLAALNMQEEVNRLAVETQGRDSVELRHPHLFTDGGVTERPRTDLAGNHLTGIQAHPQPPEAIHLSPGAAAPDDIGQGAEVRCSRAGRALGDSCMNWEFSAEPGFRRAAELDACRHRRRDISA